MNAVPTVVVIKPPPQPEYHVGIIDYVVRVCEGRKHRDYQFQEVELAKAVDFFRSQPDERDAELLCLGLDDRHEKVWTRLKPNGRWDRWEAF